MSKQLFANNASALLAASIGDNDLTIQVESGFGALFPNPGADEYFIVTLENAEGDIEDCLIESRAGDLLTVATGGRGYDGTSAQAWTNGQTRVECRLTKAGLNTFVQRDGDALTGNLDFAGNEAQDARLTGDTVVVGGQLVGTAIRGTEDDASNEILVPNDGSRATAGGSPILTEGDAEGIATGAFKIGMIMLWFGAEIDCPAGWAICNGANGTPDLRDRFPVGAGSSYALNATGGATTTSGNTVSDGAGVSGSTVLTVDQMPAHKHDGSAEITFPMSADDNSQAPYQRLTGSSVQADGNATFNATLKTVSAGGGQGHTHSTPAHSHAISGLSILPPYRALHFIMFVGF